MNPVTPASLSSANMPVSANSQTAAGAMAKGNSDGIGKLFDQLLDQANETQAASENEIQQFVSGKSGNIQQVVLAVAKAEMSFQMFMEIRNKLIESYNELMRMQF